ncbi:phytanoyl-CoA dioxygenase family protein [Dermatobacter hominis]|uniref:phytanoyl-CoA dioxygenase family protein n=1 Tax=Dermatobacter hominis TaxID=2884263 RepID=UPI001D0F5957|nr:phytanoyl-CoA dioxygenase family protein [Dermatobacter hominis]UDY33956.1 phytanoyl-CoA dioxygenase family protein [Dermatobacter hominis]
MLNALLVRDGWVKLPGAHLPETSRDELRAFFAAEFTGDRTGFHNDFFLPDPEFRFRATEVMAGLTYDLSQRWFAGFTPFLYTYLTKFASEQSSLFEHRDWMYVDELPGERSYILYVAVDDADDRNGMLHLVPRSHLLDGPPCGTRLIWPWLGHPDVLHRHAVPVPLKAGEAAIWDNRLIHMSFENTTPVDRIAIGLWCHRTGRGLAHFVGSDGGRVARHVVDEWFFMSQTPPQLALRDPVGPVAERFVVEPGDATEETLLRVLRGEDVTGAVEPWRFRTVEGA